MPELPEVESIKRQLEVELVNKTIQNVQLYRPNLRFNFPEDFAGILRGKRVLSLHRRAKFLLFNLSGNLTLLSHLGMSGKYVLNPDYAPIKHDHVEINFEQGLIRYNDPRRFGYMDLSHTDDLTRSKHLHNLGWEPLIDAFTPKVLFSLFQTLRSPIKTSLMNPKLVVGIGNIYACEILFQSNISPLRPCSTIQYHEAEVMHHHIQVILQQAIAAGGSTLRDHVQPNGESGNFQNSHLVYSREGKPCTICQDVIIRIVQGQRSTFFCPSCQK